MQTITLHKASNCWVARFPENSEIAAIFGTRDIPTPFTPAAKYMDVVEALQAKNPEFHVE